MAATSGPKVVADELNIVAPKLDTRDDTLTGYTFPIPKFAKARTWPRADGGERLLPQIIAHRGYKGRFPENSLLAFEEALRTGATALETDVRITKDGVAVLDHDGDLKRFGHDRKILNYTWDEIKEYRTLAPPHVPILRLQELLEFTLQPGREKVWLLLDIKPDNIAADAIRIISSTINSIRALPDQPWNQRVLMGVWAARQIPLVAKLLPGFPIVHIGYHLAHAKRNVSAPHVGVALLIHTMLAPGGKRFIKDCKTKADPGPIIAWTVNSHEQAEWSARRGLDGIITDDPEAVAKVWERFDEHTEEPMVPLSFRACLEVIFFYCIVNGMFWWFKKLMQLEHDQVKDEQNEKKK